MAAARQLLLPRSMSPPPPTKPSHQATFSLFPAERLSDRESSTAAWLPSRRHAGGLVAQQAGGSACFFLPPASSSIPCAAPGSTHAPPPQPRTHSSGEPYAGSTFRGATCCPHLCELACRRPTQTTALRRRRARGKQARGQEGQQGRHRPATTAAASHPSAQPALLSSLALPRPRPCCTHRLPSQRSSPLPTSTPPPTQQQLLSYCSQ